MKQMSEVNIFHNPIHALRAIVLSMVIALCVSVAARADFDDLGAGARASGLGDAFTALADDAFGFYYNPAGLGFTRRAQFGGDYSKLWIGLDDASDLSMSFIALTVPINKTEKIEDTSRDFLIKSSKLNVFISSGVDTRFRTRTRHVASLALALRSFELAQFYKESTIYLGYGMPMGGKWAWGVNAKVLNEAYIVDEYIEASPVFDYGDLSSVSAFTADIGVLYNLLPRLFVGASYSDITQPNLGLKESDILPATLRVGMGWHQRDVQWGIDAMLRENIWYGSFGLEKWFKQAVAIRGGFTLGSGSFFSPAIGFSFNALAGQIDYVFKYPGSDIKGVEGTHRVSLMYRFGARNQSDVVPGSLEQYYIELKKKTDNLEKNLAETDRERHRLESILVEEATMRIKEKIRAAKSRERQAAVQSKKKKVIKQVNHRVKKGETLKTIAIQYFGDAKYWNEIYKENRGKVGRGGSVKANQILVIPLSKVKKIVSGGVGGRVRKVGGTSPAVKVIKSGGAAAIPVRATAVPAGTPAVKKVIVTPVGAGSAASVVPVNAKTSKRPLPKNPSHKAKTKPSKPKGPRKHIVRPGENLNEIAKKYYGNSNRWKEIYKANKDKIIAGQVMPGQELLIP